MGQILLRRATTTEAIRRAIQNSQESLKVLAKRHGINPKTVAKWKKRTAVNDLSTGPKEPKSTVLTIEEEAIIVAFRRHTLLPLDDCLYALQATIPNLTRSSLHRCLHRHGISRLPDVEGDKPEKKKFKSYPIGYGAKGKRGRRANNRLFLNALLWMARSGARWRGLPEKFGQSDAVKRRYYRWVEFGALDRLFEALAVEADLEWLMIDSTIIRAHPQAGGARRKRGDLKPRALAVHVAA